LLRPPRLIPRNNATYVFRLLPALLARGIASLSGYSKS
jgi:hypothetical protein